MIYWKEWRRLRGRLLALAAFYLITALFIPIPEISRAFEFMAIPVYLLSWGAGLLLAPAILGMDMYVGEKDEGTETFLFSKPIPPGRLLIAKVGMRLLFTVLLTSAILAILLFRFDVAGYNLYLSTPPYVIWSILAAILAAQATVLLLTMLISVRAPYQSTALIIGSSLGASVCGIVVLTRFWRVQVLQSIWPSFWLLVLISLISAFGAGYLMLTLDVKGKAA